MRQRLRCERGQAAVEFVAVLPFVLLAGLVAWQFVLAGHVAWDAAGAARAGARAALVGRSAASAARSALPPPLRRGAQVVSVPGSGRAVRVSVPIPFVVYRWRLPLRVSAAASLGG